jgi:CHAD domain-containing protein
MSSVPEAFREIETKFDVPSGFALPDLSRFAGPQGRVDVDTVELANTYYDTAAMTLLRFHLTLRRRMASGATSDVGWQLKVPGSGFRTELHWPLDESDQPPDALLSLLEPFLDGRELAAAVRLEVTRTRHRLIADDGQLVAEVAQDDVAAVELAVPVRAAHWQELEVELGPAGDQSALRRIGRTVAKADAEPSTSRSKLARSVAGIGNESVGGPRTSAGAVLSDYVAVQVDAIVSGHFAIHADAEESVHSTRVGVRRLRSTLRTFSACYDPDPAAVLGDELRWYAGVLGAVRDLEVLRVRLARLVAEVPSDLVVGPVAQRIDARLAEQQTSARAQLLATITGERYTALLARLVDWRDNPPFTTAAGRPATTLTKSVRRADKVLHKRLHRATGAQGTDTEMHSARKAGKRARYAGEVAPGPTSSRQAKKLQDLLGEFQDSVVAATIIRTLAEQAHSAGEDTFTYGLLFADERAAADAARSRARARERG